MIFFNDNDNNDKKEKADVQEQEGEKVVQMPERKPFQVWEVDGERYRLKLDTAGISELEQKYKTNLMNIMGTGNGGMPALTVMLDVTHAAMKKYNHGIKREALNTLFDKYLTGSIFSFVRPLVIRIFLLFSAVSKFSIFEKILYLSISSTISSGSLILPFAL